MARAVRQLREDAVLVFELRLSTAFDDPSLIKDKNAIRVQQCGQAMSYGNDAAIAACGINRVPYLTFTDGVQGGSPFIEDQNRRILEKDPSERKPLPLSA